MEHKQLSDKKKPGYPWTPRQRRQLKGNRKSRKMARRETRNR